MAVLDKIVRRCLDSVGHPRLGRETIVNTGIAGSPATAGASLLDPHTLMDVASTECGLSDWGDGAFLGPMQRWLAAVVSEAGLSEAGTRLLAMLVKGWLVNRLRFVDDVAHHPEILDEVITEPVFVTGMPRTGTTKLQRVLASDPEMRGIPLWQTMNFARVPGAEGAADPRIAVADGFVSMMAQMSPDFLTAHPTGVNEPEEESFIIETTFESQTNCTRVRAPSLWATLRDQPHRERHDYLHRVLCYLQWQGGPDDRRTWVLKSPLHAGNLTQLFAAFPDATVVCTHRDPRVALPSNCRITEVFRGMTTDTIDLEELGREQLEMWSDNLRRNVEQRAQVGSDRIVDVFYDDICADIAGVVGHVQEHRGKSLDPESPELMRSWEDEHPQHQFGRHIYSLERYGLTDSEIEAAFSLYLDTFFPAQAG
jgi:Sulfotransferase family